MAIDVNKPSSSDYPTKLTSAIPPPPYRDHQHNKNQTIPTITTKDRQFHVTPTKIETTIYERFMSGFSDTSDDMFDIESTNETTTAMTTGTATTAEVTLAEFEQWEDDVDNNRGHKKENKHSNVTTTNE